MINRLSSIKTKLVFVYIILLVAILISTGYYLQNSLRNYFLNFMEDRIVKELNLIEEELKPLLMEKRQEELVIKVNRMGKNLETRLTIIDLSGKPLADSREDYKKMENHLNRPEVQAALQTGYGENKRYSPTLGIVMRYIAYPIKNEAGEELAIIRAATNLDKLQDLYQVIWQVLFKAGFIAIMVAILISLQSIKKITNPIEKITTMAEDIAKGQLEQRLTVNSRDEIGKLATMFNHMTIKIKEKVSELATEKNKIEAVISSINDAVIAVDNEGRIILFNPGAERVFAITANKVKGKSLIEVTKNYKLVELIEGSLAKGANLTEEIKLLLPEERIFRVQLAPIENNKDLIGVVLVLRDITEIRKLERMRRDFVANVSHELKTPLTSIKGYVETLLESEADKKTAHNFLTVINEETNRLEKLIFDLLDLAKLESERSYFKMEQINLEKVINDAVSILKNKADKKDIEFNLNVETRLVIKGDKDQLTRLVINLLDNAIKYTPKGGNVKLELTQEKNWAKIKITDNGIGIPEAELTRIFERFYRVDKARSREEGGTGLGLAIVKHIVKQHKGKVEVESELGAGTEFIIALPFKN